MTESMFSPELQRRYLACLRRYLSYTAIKHAGEITPGSFRSFIEFGTKYEDRVDTFVTAAITLRRLFESGLTEERAVRDAIGLSEQADSTGESDPGPASEHAPEMKPVETSKPHDSSDLERGGQALSPSTHDFIPVSELDARRLVQVFEAASFEPNLLPDGLIEIRVGGLDLSSQFDPARQLLKVVGMTRFKSNVDMEKKLDLANRVHTGSRAVRCGILESHPDILFLDWYMPTFGGVTETQVIEFLNLFQVFVIGVQQLKDTDGILH